MVRGGKMDFSVTRKAHAKVLLFLGFLVTGKSYFPRAKNMIGQLCFAVIQTLFVSSPWKIIIHSLAILYIMKLDKYINQMVEITCTIKHPDYDSKQTRALY